MITDEPSQIFYAYPSVPESAKDAAASAVKDLEHTHLATVQPWEGLYINGRIIPTEVFAAIDRADILIGDLTGLNANVLFEVGYAIGRGKRVWLTTDVSRTPRETIAAGVPPLATVGTFAYQNGHQIASAFEKGYFDLLSTQPLIDQFRGLIYGLQTPTILS
jgi:nucleoside 2-deoxyribosyltransferase